MTVATYNQPDSTTQSAADYPGAIDASTSVLTRLGRMFAPHAQAAPDMTVAVDAGHIMSGQVLVEVAAQTTSAITPPASNPRIDRVVINNSTGLVSVLTGTEAVCPVAPAIPAGSSPVARVLLQVSTTAITNDAITDERDFSGMGSSASGGALLNVQTFATPGAYVYTPTPGTAKIVVEVQGGGGGGGGTGATNASQAAVASGGTAGAYAKSFLTSGFSGVTVTVGAGGARNAAGANNGNPGAQSSFGDLIIAPGGPGGIAGAPFAPPIVTGNGNVSAVATGGNIINSKGAVGTKGYSLALTVVTAGDGGSSVFGGGAVGAGLSPGSDATTPGSGGSGSPAMASKAAQQGGAGAAGIVIIHEYA